MATSFPYVLNVVTPGDATGQAKAIQTAVADLGAAGAIDWLTPSHSFDVPFLDRPGETLDAARKAADGLALDVNVVGAEGRRKKLLVADMDSTIITCECLDELADMAGLKPAIAAITARAMNGEIDFAPALRERVALLKGLELAALERVWRERVRLAAGAKELVLTMRAAGARTLLVSGGFTYFTSRVAQAAGFQEARGNRLKDDGTALTGVVEEPVLGRAAKSEALESTARSMKIDPKEAVAVGDGANDLDMIRRAGLGVAYHARPVVAAAAPQRVDHGDLTALLYLQGYRGSEIVRPA